MDGRTPAAGSLLISRAAHFAAARHADQRRKGARAEPYVNHLAEVAALLAEATGGDDPALIAAGFLHDTVEDTATTLAEIAERFGRDVADLVAAVTDDKSLPKDARKRRQIAEAPFLADRAKRLKIADKISNLRSLMVSPPTAWSHDRVTGYGDWAAAVVAGCRGADPGLEREFDAVLAAFRRLYAAAGS